MLNLFSPLISLFEGPAYDLSFSEVRGHSLVFLWKAPIYTGAGAVTGYFVDMAKKGSSEFITLNEEAVKHRYLHVSLSGDIKNIRGRQNYLGLL